jgi:hypothetical protein
MPPPVPPNEVLEILYRKKSECAARIYEAEARGDFKEVRALQFHSREIVSLIKERGGDLIA